MDPTKPLFVDPPTNPSTDLHAGPPPDIRPGDTVTLPDGRVLENVDVFPPYEPPGLDHEGSARRYQQQGYQTIQETHSARESAAMQALRQENAHLRRQLQELREQPETDAAFQEAFTGAFASPPSLRTASEEALQGLELALIHLVKSAAEPRAVRNAAEAIMHLIDVR